MVEAIKLVLEQRHFRAGAYTIGYRSCDDSTAQAGGFDKFAPTRTRRLTRATPK